MDKRANPMTFCANTHSQNQHSQNQHNQNQHSQNQHSQNQHSQDQHVETGIATPRFLVQALLHTLRRLGHDIDTLIQQTDLNLQQEEIDDVYLLRLWDLLVHPQTDARLLIDIAREMRLGALAPLDLAALSAVSVGAAMHLVGDFVHLFAGTTLHIDITETAQRWTAAWVNVLDYPLNAFWDVMGLGILVARLAEHACSPVYPAEVHFTLAPAFVKEPRAYAAFLEHFGGSRACQTKLYFGAPISKMVYTQEAWQTPLLASDPALHDVLVGRLVPSLSVLHRLRGIFLQHLADPPDVSQAAQKLGISARTLQRILQDEGTNFRAVLEDVRIREAKLLLRDPQQKIASIADALGFADAAAFTRAFTRAVGQSPSSFRAAAP